MRIAVIGSGFGGLSAAIRLQAQGHDVSIFEKLDQPGGRAYVFKQDGFTFDAGPTIITAPWLIDEMFALTGRTTQDYVSLVKLDPFYNIRFEDGSVFRYNGDREALVQQVREFSPDDVDGYLRFREKCWEIFNVGMPLIDKPFNTIGSMLKVIPALVRLRSDRSVARLAEHFMKDERLRQVFSFHPLLVGGNPFQASSMYALIHKLEQQWGVLFAMGGTGALVRGLVQAFQDLGGHIRFESEIAEITLDVGRKRTTGVRLTSGESFAADAVVCNGDISQSYRTLLPAAARPAMSDAKIARYRHSMSLFVIYFGTDRKYDNMAHHEILMGPRYRELLRDIFDRKKSPWFREEFVDLRAGDALSLPLDDGCAGVTAQNCLFNIFQSGDLARALGEIYRVLQPRGRFVTSDPVAPCELPAHLRNDARLRAMCLSGSITLDQYLAAMVAVGFGTLEVRARRPYRVLDPARYGVDQTILLESVEVAAIKDPIPDDGPCIFTGRTAIYFGPEDAYDDGAGHVLSSDMPLSVCEKTAAKLQRLERNDLLITAPTWFYDGGGCC